MRSISPESNFASSTSLLDLTLPAHNAVLAGDSLTTLALNYKWRKIIAIALQFWFTHGDTTLAMTNEDYFEGLIQDLYTAEVIGLKTTTYYAALASDKTRSNAAFAAVSGFALNHTFTHTKAKITISNIRGNLSVNTQRGSVRGTLSSGTRVTTDSIGFVTTTQRDLRWAGEFTAIPTGTPLTIGLEFAASGGSTITLQAADNMVVEIEEYD